MSDYVGKDGEASLWINQEKREGQHDASGDAWIGGKSYPFNVNTEDVNVQGRNVNAPTHKGYVDVNGTHKQVSLWKQAELKTPNHPTFTGYYEDGDDQYRVALWKKKEDAHPKSPDYRGTLGLQEEPRKKNAQKPKSEPRQQQQANDGFSQKAASSSKFDLDSDIPF